MVDTTKNEPVNESDAAAIISAIQRQHDVDVRTTFDGNEYVVLPSGKRVESLKSINDTYRKMPERRKGIAAITTLASFIEHVQRFSDEDSVVFADRGAQGSMIATSMAPPTLLALYNYHAAGSAYSVANWCDYGARYTPPVSPEWQAWRAGAGVEMDATAFARFLEDRITEVSAVDVSAPENEKLAKLAQSVGGTFASPLQLLTMARSIEISAAVNVRQMVTLPTGEISVAYSETHQDGSGQAVKIPNLFAVVVPVFRDGAAYRLPCRLRYRLTGGKVVWSYLLVNPDGALDDALKDIVTAVGTETGLKVFFGTPEK